MCAEHPASFYWLDFDRRIYMCQRLDRRHLLAKKRQSVLMNPYQGRVNAGLLDPNATNILTNLVDIEALPYRPAALLIDDFYWLYAEAVNQPKPLAPLVPMLHQHCHLIKTTKESNGKWKRDTPQQHKRHKRDKKNV